MIDWPYVILVRQGASSATVGGLTCDQGSPNVRESPRWHHRLRRDQRRLFEDGSEAADSGGRSAGGPGERQGDVSVSYNSVEMDGGFVGSGGDFDGVAYSANLDYRASSRLAFRGQFSKQIAPSVRIGDAYTVQEQWALRGTYELGSRLALEFGGDSMDERYEGLLPIAGPGLAVKDSRINTVYGALTYKPTDRLTLRLNIERQERDADNDLFDYTSDRIGLKADFGLF